MEKLKYPIGTFTYVPAKNSKQIEEWIHSLEILPEKLKALVAHFSEEQLNTPYRPGGWTARQVIHHIADSHHHSYTRFKWAMTENEPLIKAYMEKEWSNLFDAKTAPIQMSLAYITALHAKLVYFLKGLSTDDLKKHYIHPDGNVAVTVEENIAKYVWHGNHHFAHIETLAQREGWL